MFLPAGLLEDLLTEEAVIKVLDGESRVNPQDLFLQRGLEKKQVVDFVRLDAKKSVPDCCPQWLPW